MTTWNTATPLDSDQASEGATRIREAKDALQESFRAQQSEGTEAVFPGSDSDNPVYRPRLPKGAEGSRPAASADQGLYINETKNSIDRCDDSNWTAIASLIPSGLIAPYGGASAPGGWLLCDGSAVSRTTYANLFTAIGTAFGEGDGATTFHLPDLRGRFLRGVDSGQGNDPDAASRTAMATGGNTGDNVGSVQADATALPNTDFTTDDPGNHNHSYHDAQDLIAYNTGPGGAYVGDNIATSTGNNGSHTHTVDGGGDNETRPLNAGVNYIIKI